MSAFAIIKNIRNVFCSLFHSYVDLGYMSKQNVKPTKKNKELIKQLTTGTVTFGILDFCSGFPKGHV